MSQIPRSQFAQKKRQSAPMATIPVLDIEAKTKKSHTNGSSNGNGQKTVFDNEVVIVEDDMFAVVSHVEVVEEVVAEPVEEPSPGKKKRSRRSKDSTESKESEMKFVKAAAQEEPKAEATVAAEPSLKDTKILKLSADELLSKRRSDRLQNASTIVNLSTVSSTDQSTKIINDDDTLETPTEKRVSGRRSTRPIDEIKYTYRQPNPDDSLNGTTNATIGSEINNDSLLNTPATDRKRRPITESSENLDSPKRSRLDLSGLFSSFSSPVALLRNRFKRTNIASTPVAGGAEGLLNDSIESLDTSAGDDQMKEIDLNEKEVVASDVVVENEEELKVITTPVKKTTCVIM